jgi:uncharacterized protein YukE
MNDILIKPPRLREVATQVREHTKKIQQALQEVDTALNGLGVPRYAGNRSDTLRKRYAKIKPNIMKAPATLDGFAKDLDEAALRFETADRQWVNENVPFRTPSGQDVKSNFETMFKDLWNNLTPEQRQQMMEDFQKALVDKYGHPGVELKVNDLVDPPGQDALGVTTRYSNGKTTITIDLTNVENDDPLHVLDTVAHENRHVMQQYWVDHPDKAPADVTKEQIDAWRENFKNYHDPANGMKAYQDQPVEADARSFADDFLQDYFASSDDFAAFLKGSGDLVI